MGCLLAAVAALVSLAMPASIARASLVGAYVLIVLLALAALGAVAYRQRGATAVGASPASRLRGPGIRIGALAVVYGIVVTVVHVA